MSIEYGNSKDPTGSTSFPSSFSQTDRLGQVTDLFARTYAVTDPPAVAVTARKTLSRWFQAFTPLDQLLADSQTGQVTIPEVFENDLTDVYAGLSLYYRPWRCASTVRWLPLAFVDIDCHKRGFTDVQAIPHVLEICRDRGFPEPTEIAFTGRGLLARWQLEPVRAWPENLALWDSVQRALCQAFEPLGAEHEARDCARVSRPDGTVNSKSGRVVRTVWCSKETYTLDTLALSLEVVFRPSGKKRAKRSRFKTPVRVLVPRNPQKFNLAIEGLRRVQDLTELVQLRGAMWGGHDTVRWNFLVVFTHSARLTNWPEGTIRKQAHLFNQGFEEPLHEEEVNRAVAQGLRRFSLRSRTLVERLGISQAEQAYMSTLVDEVERERRRVLRQWESETARRVLRAFEGHPGARQIDLAELTTFAQSTISKNLAVLELKTTPHKDGRGPFKKGFLKRQQSHSHSRFQNIFP